MAVLSASPANHKPESRGSPHLVASFLSPCPCRHQQTQSNQRYGPTSLATHQPRLAAASTSPSHTPVPHSNGNKKPRRTHATGRPKMQGPQVAATKFPHPRLRAGNDSKSGLHSTGPANPMAVTAAGAAAAATPVWAPSHWSRTMPNGRKPGKLALWIKH